mgnify:CR=1 FL=1
MISQLWEYDEAVRNSTGNFFCGVDEAGRGPLAGDVYAAAVVLDPDRPIEGLNDSKKLSAKKRELLYEEIIDKSLDYCIARATVEEIEEIIPKPVEFPEIISPTISPQQKMYRPLFALKTNLLYNLLSGLNVEVEVPIGEHFSLAGE